MNFSEVSEVIQVVVFRDFRKTLGSFKIDYSGFQKGLREVFLVGI